MLDFIFYVWQNIGMRSYGQHCAVAKALDVIGDRWTLLIVRELMIRDGCRYTDLRNGLPGIATNLLAERLAEMEAAGLLEREAARPPVATTLFRLTARGRELEPVIAALGIWGAPLLPRKPDKAGFRDHWIALPIRLYLRDRHPEREPIRISIRCGDEWLTLATLGDGSVEVRSGSTNSPHLKLEGNPQMILSVLLGKTQIAIAEGEGLNIAGDVGILQRFRPVPAIAG